MLTLANGISLPDELQLFECESSRTCVAGVCELTRDIADQKVDLTWWSELDLHRDLRRAQPDSDWRWVKLRGLLRQKFGANGYGWCVCTENGDCQGAILYQVGAFSSFDEDAATLFCHRLATAPRNRSSLTRYPRYRGVGTGLIRLAALHSFRAGLKGRVTVETYEDQDARDWYERLGFQRTPKDSGGIVDFELVPEAASRLLADLLV